MSQSATSRRRRRRERDLGLAQLGQQVAAKTVALSVEVERRLKAGAAVAVSLVQ